MSMSFKTVLLIIVLIIGVIACTRGLGDIISLNLVEKEAIKYGYYCYSKESGAQFCMLYLGELPGEVK